jgi:hypothetical protein
MKADEDVPLEDVVEPENTQTNEIEPQQTATITSRLSKVPLIGNIIHALSSYLRLIIYQPEFRWIWLAGVVR